MWELVLQGLQELALQELVLQELEVPLGLVWVELYYRGMAPK